MEQLTPKDLEGVKQSSRKRETKAHFNKKSVYLQQRLLKMHITVAVLWFSKGKAERHAVLEKPEHNWIKLSRSLKWHMKSSPLHPLNGSVSTTVWKHLSWAANATNYNLFHHKVNSRMHRGS